MIKMIEKIKNIKIQTKKAILLLFGAITIVYLVIAGVKIFKLVEISRCGPVMITDDGIITGNGYPIQCNSLEGFSFCKLADEDNVYSYFVFTKEGKYGFIAVDVTTLPNPEEVCKQQIGGIISTDIKSRKLCVRPEDYVPCE